MPTTASTDEVSKRISSAYPLNYRTRWCCVACDHETLLPSVNCINEGSTAYTKKPQSVIAKRRSLWEHPNCANTFSCGTGILPVKGKGRAGYPPHNKLSLQKWDAPDRFTVVSCASTKYLQ
jgi:hypothetical protein